MRKVKLVIYSLKSFTNTLKFSLRHTPSRIRISAGRVPLEAVGIKMDQNNWRSEQCPSKQQLERETVEHALIANTTTQRRAIVTLTSLAALSFEGNQRIEGTAAQEKRSRIFGS